MTHDIHHYVHLLTVFWQYLDAHWTTIGAYTVGGLSLSVVFQLLKKKLKLDKVDDFKLLKLIRLDSARFVGLLFTIFTFAATLANYILNVNSMSPTTIPKTFFPLLGVALFLHNVFVSPTFKWVASKISTSAYFGAVTQLKAAKAAQVDTPVIPDPMTTLQS